MPALKDTKEIKQFLGLTGYYRKFVPRFADISRPLTTLTKKRQEILVDSRMPEIIRPTEENSVW